MINQGLFILKRFLALFARITQTRFLFIRIGFHSFPQAVVLFKQKFVAEFCATGGAQVTLAVFVNKCQVVVLGFISVEAFEASFALELVVIFGF